MIQSTSFSFITTPDEDYKSLSKWAKNHCLELDRILRGMASLQNSTHAALTLGTANGLTLAAGQILSLPTTADMTLNSLTSNSIKFPAFTAGVDGLLIYRGTDVIWSDFAPSTASERNLFIGRAGNNTMPTGSAFQSCGNVAIGHSAFVSNTLGFSNVAIGYGASQYNTTGFRNVSLGLGSLLGNTTGSDNVAIGTSALAGATLTAKSFNVALGYYAGQAVTSGGYNVLLGYQAGLNITTGSNNIIIGQNVSADSATGDYQLKIDNLMAGNFASGSEYLDVTNHLGITSMRLGTPTYKYIDDYMNTVQSSGRISGMVLSDGGSGTLTISAGTGMIRTTNGIGITKFFDYAGESAKDILTDGQLNYVYMDYNGGNPTVLATVSRPGIHDYDQFTIGRVFRTGTTLDFVNSGTNIYNEHRRTHNRLVKRYGFAWASGSTTSESGSLGLAVTAGVWYIGNTEIDTGALTGGGAFNTYYWNPGTSAWVKTTGVTTIDNLQYNDIATGLVNITGNKYVNAWIYQCPQGDIYHVYGQAEYASLANAQATTAPSSVPTYIGANSRLIARITLKQGATNFTAISNALITAMPSGVATDHANLAGLLGGSPAYHITSAQWNSGNLAAATATSATSATSATTAGNLTGGNGGDILVMNGSGNVGTYTAQSSIVGIGNALACSGTAAVAAALDAASAYGCLSLDGTNFVKSTSGYLAAGTYVSAATYVSAGTYLTVNTTTVLNESGGDNDTRIEGDTDTNLIFVDASTDRVGIGTATPVSKLDILTAARSGTHGSPAGLYITGGLAVGSGGWEIRHSNGTQGISAGYNELNATGSDANVPIHLRSKGTGHAVVASPGGDVIVETNSLTRLTVDVNGVALFEQVMGVKTNAGFRLYNAANNAWATLGFDSTNVTNNFGLEIDKALIANQGGGDYDTRIEGDTDANLIFADASADKVGIGTNAPAAKLDVNSDTIILRTAKTPANAGDTGTTGMIAWDSGFIYVCVATNTWKKAAIATW